MGSLTRPSEISLTYSPGTVPTFTTSVRQLCTIMRSKGMSPNMAFHSLSVTGTCVPSAGMMSTSQ